MTGNHGVHELRCADDGIDRAGRETEGTTDASLLIYMCQWVCQNLRGEFRPGALHVTCQWQWCSAEQRCKIVDGGLATRRAAVNVGTIGDCFSVGATSGIATLSALGLRQKRLD
jgi:hypothetical protein